MVEIGLLSAVMLVSAVMIVRGVSDLNDIFNQAYKNNDNQANSTDPTP